MREELDPGIADLHLPVQLALELPHEEGLIINAAKNEGKAQPESGNYYEWKNGPPKKLSTNSRHTPILPYRR
jgi:hypothetical protein